MNRRIYLVLLCVIVMFVAKIKAETIFETFNTDPTGSTWTCRIDGNSTFTYTYSASTGGYLNVGFIRDLTKVDRYTTALDATYDRTKEYWWEMDMQMDSTSYFGTKMGSTGVFKSDANNARSNMVGEYGYKTGIYSHRIDWLVYLDSGVVRYAVASDCANDVTLRLKTHYWWSVEDSNGYVKMDVYDIPTDTLLGTTGRFCAVKATESVSYDTFGLANKFGTPYSAIPLRAKIDNLYFSTEGSNANPVTPFIPEPATMCLLALGGIHICTRRTQRRIKKE